MYDIKNCEKQGRYFAGGRGKQVDLTRTLVSMQLSSHGSLTREHGMLLLLQQFLRKEHSGFYPGSLFLGGNMVDKDSKKGLSTLLCTVFSLKGHLLQASFSF